MSGKIIKNLINTIQSGQKAVASLSVKDKKSLERKWDIEHAYYSSALEGSKIDRKEFDKLAKNVS
ncbi:MAG TPA: hypothetical protein VIH31_02405 [Candidatus Paceibacterota bacterium]